MPASLLSLHFGPHPHFYLFHTLLLLTMATSSASSASSRSSYDSERVSATVGETQALWFEVNSIPLIIDAPLEVVWRVVDEICEHPDS